MCLQLFKNGPYKAAEVTCTCAEKERGRALEVAHANGRFFARREVEATFKECYRKLKRTDESGKGLCDVTDSYLCDWQTKATIKRHDRVIEVGPRVLFDRITILCHC